MCLIPMFSTLTEKNRPKLQQCNSSYRHTVLCLIGWSARIATIGRLLRQVAAVLDRFFFDFLETLKKQRHIKLLLVHHTETLHCIFFPLRVLRKHWLSRKTHQLCHVSVFCRPRPEGMDVVVCYTRPKSFSHLITPVLKERKLSV